MQERPSGDLPDLFIANNGSLSEWVDNGLVADLTDVVQSPNGPGLRARPCLRYLLFDGKVYGVPNALNTGQVFVNTKAFKGKWYRRYSKDMGGHGGNCPGIEMK